MNELGEVPPEPSRQQRGSSWLWTPMNEYTSVLERGAVVSHVLFAEISAHNHTLVREVVCRPVHDLSVQEPTQGQRMAVLLRCFEAMRRHFVTWF